MNIKPKRKYEKKFKNRLGQHNDFIIDRLRKEWDGLKKSERRDRMLQGVKDNAATVAKTLLAIAAVGGAVAVAAMAPNAVGAIGKSWERRGFFNKREFQRASSYLKQRKYAVITPNGEGKYTVKITDKGMLRVARQVLNGFAIARPQHWDGWWRVIIFDISDKHKNERNLFREKLKMLGFYKLQESVFVIPYPCEEELRFLISILNISGYVRFIKTQHISEDGDLKAYFSLN